MDGRCLARPKRCVVSSLRLSPQAVLHRWVGRPLLRGVLLGLCAMAGDLLSSCLKRRLGIKSSERALGLDQSLEALGPVLVLQKSFAFQTVDIVIVVLAFFVLESGLSRVLYRLHIRDRPM